MEVGRLYKLSRGNQNQDVGLIIKGTTPAIQIYGSQSLPNAISDMILCTNDDVILDAGSWSFSMLPEYISFTGTGADAIELIGMGFEDIKAIS